MYIRKTIFFCVLIALCLTIKAEISILPKHPQATLIEKKETPEGENEYHYRSQLSRERIVMFYQEMLSYQGWKDKDAAEAVSYGDSSYFTSKKTFIFTKKYKKVLLEFSDFKESNLTLFSIKIGDKDTLGKSIQPIQLVKEEKMGLLPFLEYPQAKKVVFDRSDKGLKAIYEASGDLEGVVEFYLKEMFLLDWELKSKEYLDSEALAAESGCSQCEGEHSLEEKPVLPKDIRGVILKFKKNNEECSIGIQENSKIDSTFQKGGDIIIAISYYASK